MDGKIGAMGDRLLEPCSNRCALSYLQSCPLMNELDDRLMIV
ncbi:hypothetical protein [Leptolyngbya ohadii]|nr:hypothetical protein [Leptolyngbya ohadii]